MRRWERMDALSAAARARMAADDTARTIMRIGQRFALSQEQVAWVARAVRDYYLGDVAIDAIDNYLMTRASLTPGRAQSIANAIAKHILQKSVKTTKVQMTLQEALQQFPEIAQQQVTTASLRTSDGKVVPGTVRNWLAHYHSTMGAAGHTAIDRGRYLFHNSNTRDLSAAQRQRVALILKAADEKRHVTIDRERREIVFPPAQIVPQRQAGSAPPPTTVPRAEQRADRVATQDHAIMKKASAARQPVGYARFSSGQVLAHERQGARQTNTQKTRR